MQQRFIMPQRKRTTTGSTKVSRGKRPPGKRRKQPGGIDAASLATNRLIADFMKASSRVEQYLQAKRPLTDLQYDSIATTTDGLRTFLLTWRTHFRRAT